jgi:hypothetical protein
MDGWLDGLVGELSDLMGGSVDGLMDGWMGR